MATPSPRGGGRPSPLGKYKGRTANGSEKYLSNEVSKLPNLWELKMKKSSNQLISKKANIFHLKIKRRGIPAGIPVGNLDTLVSRNLDTLVSPLLTPLGQYKGRDVNTQGVRWPPLFTRSEAREGEKHLLIIHKILLKILLKIYLNSSYAPSIDEKNH